jgi:hypothetical protein
MSAHSIDGKPAIVKEAAIERELVHRVERMGGVCEKVMIVGKRGFFDRLIILPGPRARIIFAELKRPKRGRIAPHQQWYHDQYKALGVEVYFVRNAADIDRLLAAP